MKPAHTGTETLCLQPPLNAHAQAPGMNAGSFRSWERSWLTAGKETGTSTLQPQGIKLCPQLDLIHLGQGRNLEAFLIQEFWGHTGDINIDNIQQLTGWHILVEGTVDTRELNLTDSLEAEVISIAFSKFPGNFFLRRRQQTKYSLSWSKLISKS